MSFPARDNPSAPDSLIQSGARRNGRIPKAHRIAYAGWILSALGASVSIGAIVSVVIDWWPFTNNLTDIAGGLYFVLSVGILILFGFLWIVCTLVMRGQSKTKKRLKYAFPAALLAGIAIVTLCAMFYPDDFTSSRSALEDVAKQVVDNPAGWSETYSSSSPRKIGSVEVKSISVGPNGVVHFTDADSGLREWVYSELGPSAMSELGSFSHISGPWYTFSIDW